MAGHRAAVAAGQGDRQQAELPGRPQAGQHARAVAVGGDARARCPRAPPGSGSGARRSPRCRPAPRRRSPWPRRWSARSRAARACRRSPGARTPPPRAGRPRWPRRCRRPPACRPGGSGPPSRGRRRRPRGLAGQVPVGRDPPLEQDRVAPRPSGWVSHGWPPGGRCRPRRPRRRAACSAPNMPEYGLIPKLGLDHGPGGLVAAVAGLADGQRERPGLAVQGQRAADRAAAADRPARTAPR